MTRLADAVFHLRDMVEAKADQQEVDRIESALLAFAKPRSGVTGTAPLHERLSLITPMMGAIADARTAGLNVPSMLDSTAAGRRPPSARRPASASSLSKSGSAAWMPTMAHGQALLSRSPAQGGFVNAERRTVGNDGGLYRSAAIL